ncbi:MAG: sulfite exporter TauE/SafE family protein [Hydrogenothermus sp.]|nr:MAG: sulfite exporter TauE/SafE family protein [Hydrogenothermus sp.]
METIIIGFFLGLSIGLTGIGGGMLTTPFLILFMGVPVPIAVGTSLLFSAITKVFAAVIYLLRGLICTKLIFLLLVGSIPGSILGSYLLHYFYDKYPYISNKLIPIIIFIMILLSSLFSLFRLFSKSRHLTDIDIRSKSYLIPLIGFVVGFDIGFTSVGAGIIVASLLLAFCSLSPSKIVGTDIVHGLILTIFASGLHLTLDGVNTSILLDLIKGGILGVILGSIIAPYLPQKPFRLSLNIIVLVLAVLLLRNTI